MSIPLEITPHSFFRAQSGELPSRYTRVAFLESDGSQVIDTEVLLDAPVYMLFTYQLLGWGGYNEHNFVENLTTNPVHRVMFGEGNTGDSSYVWAWIAKGGQAGNLTASPIRLPKLEKNVVSWTPTQLFINETEMRLSNAVALSGNTLNRALCFMGRPADETGYKGYSSTRFWSFAFGFAAADEYVFTPVVSADGEPGMWEENQGKFYPNRWNGAFSAGIETLDQLTTLASNLPRKSGTIKLSLPGEWNGDADVNAQLSTINSKGWQATITYRDAEASSVSTLSLRRIRAATSAMVVWCKATESDTGNYKDADGVRYYVEMCHDIWHPSGLTPDDLGYTAALTLADYLTERGLTAVVYPEDEDFTRN